MLADVLHHTNKKINPLLAKLPADFNKDFKYSFVKEVSEMELKAFIGLFLYRGLYKLNTMGIRKLFSEKLPPIFCAVMSRNRLAFILHNLSFDDESTRAEKWEKDRFTSIREFFQKFNYQCMLVLAPGDYLSLDETLYPMRMQISFKQFNPSKPAKYGVLFKSVNATRYPYTFIPSPHSGKPTEEGGQYYIQGTEDIAHYLIEALSTNSSLADRNISFDQLYTSIPLAKCLLEKLITCIGTMQLNRKGIPDELNELLSSDIYWDENSPLPILSYVVKTSKGEKNVILLFTTPPILSITKDDRKSKLGIYKVYDFKKGATDIIDQRMGFYTCKPKSRKWTITVFSYVIDMARVNSSTTFTLQKDMILVNRILLNIATLYCIS